MSDEAEDAAHALAELQPDLSVELGKEAEASAAQLMASATVCLKILNGIQRDMDLIVERTRLEVSSIEGMASRELAPLRARFAHIEEYAKHLALLTEWPKRKASHDTPFGSFGIRRTAATVELVDDEKTLAWAMRQETGKFFALKPTLKWSELKKTLDASEDVLPDGVECVDAKVTPYIKLS